MSLRNLIRLLAACSTAIPVTLLTTKASGAWLLLCGLAGLLLAVGYLALLAREGDLTRWQLRYHLEPGTGTERLEATLRYLVDRAGHVVLEANAEGLFLELPQVLDRYVEAQLPRALPELRLSRDESGTPGAGRSFFLNVGPLSSELLRWASESDGAQVRLHLQQGPFATLILRSDRRPPLGHWVKLPLPKPLKRIWQQMPAWDELSAGVHVSALFPSTSDGCAYSSRSRLLQLVPPGNYQADTEGRTLGESGDGRTLTLSHNVLLSTVAAPSTFLIRQALDDLQDGRSVIVVSPHHRVLEQTRRLAGGMPVHWFDPERSFWSSHLAIVTAEECTANDVETVISTTQVFLGDLGLDMYLPAVASFTGHLIRALANAARQSRNDLPFTDLYLVSQSTQALRSFLNDARDLAGESGRELLALLDGDAGYVQAVTILSAIRTALRPLGTGPFQGLCAEPFVNPTKALAEQCLFLVPMTDTDFPEHNRLLGAMLDLVLGRVLSSGPDLKLSLHLHDPHLYRADLGERWVSTARHDPRLSLLVDTQDPDAYRPAENEPKGEVIFYCTEALASTIVADWPLPVSVAELMELPSNVAVARLPGMAVALKTNNA
jgi:hypothetical protein